MTPWRQALTRAINAEVAAEKAATQAEGERRRTWWATTWALAAVPRAEWSEAQAEYVRRTSHNKSTADHRRRTGERLPETALGRSLPQPRFAETAANWIGKSSDSAKVTEAITLLAQAERDEQSLREFKLALTGRPWTNAPENLSEAQEDAVVERVARSRPKTVAKQAAKPTVAAQIVEDPAATKQVIQQQSKRTQRLVNKRKEAVAAAGADVKGEVNDAVTAGLGVMDNTPGYNRMRKAESEERRAWAEGTKEQSFNRLDIHMLTADQNARDRHGAEVRCFIEAAAEDRDPYMALAEHRAEVNEELQRQMDEAEAGTDLDAGLSEIERFANEGL